MQNHYNLVYREEEREMMPTLKAGFVILGPLVRTLIVYAHSTLALDQFLGPLLLTVFSLVPLVQEPNGVKWISMWSYALFSLGVAQLCTGIFRHTPEGQEQILQVKLLSAWRRSRRREISVWHK